MLITTTSSIEGHKIEKYLGIANGEAVIGSSVLNDLLAGFKDVVGGRSKNYEEIMRKAQSAATNEMEKHAKAMGADAIVGVDIDFVTINKDMLMVGANGTAVKLAD